ncbi:MAG: arabinogalactan endo-1,4-beta-galactosidase [Bacteroidetes bacterium]|nr:arabinogalactan endo-1,4-beta-galactosidase [Bacteroidota bacterium]
MLSSKSACILLSFLTILMGLGCKKESNNQTKQPVADSLIRGIDASFLSEAWKAGTTYKDESGNPVDFLPFVKLKGVNTIRVRIWHTPSGRFSNFEDVAFLAEQIRKNGLKLWLCIHYSDWWADPANQKTPLAWSGLSQNLLKDSLVNYTRILVRELKPDFIQTGNEINGGMCWEEGRIANEGYFFGLLKAANEAVTEEKPDCKRLIHIAGYDKADWFFGKALSYQVPYDWMAISYYTYWHGKDPENLQPALDGLFSKYKKGIVIAETAYPFTLSWNDWTNNVIGDTSQLSSGYPATPLGQKELLIRISKAVYSSQGGRGFCYWAPEWVSFYGPQSNKGSSWENQALFDFSNKALPAWEAFNPLLKTQN